MSRHRLRPGTCPPHARPLPGHCPCCQATARHLAHCCQATARPLIPGLARPSVAEYRTNSSEIPKKCHWNFTEITMKFRRNSNGIPVKIQWNPSETGDWHSNESPMEFQWKSNEIQWNVNEIPMTFQWSSNEIPLKFQRNSLGCWGRRSLLPGHRTPDPLLPSQ